MKLKPLLTWTHTQFYLDIKKKYPDDITNIKHRSALNVIHDDD